jgi:hypothetical protein
VAGCSSLTVERLGFPIEELPEDQRRKVEHVLEDVAAAVPLEAEEVQSSLEIYDFLLDEMPFTGGVVRELGRGKWLISRDAGDVGGFTVADPAGYRLRFELVRKEPTRRVYVTAGIFHMGILPPLEGSTVIVMRMIPAGPLVRTDATVYVRVETPFYAGLAKGLRGVVEDKVRERSAVFIRAARWVAEEAARRPDWLVMQVDGSDKVDQAVLAEFRKRFLR